MAREHPLRLAIIIDLIKILPYIDLPISLPLQWILWSEQDNNNIKWANMLYNIGGDLLVIGDIFPLNTVCVLLGMARKKS
jgi:hypothetical protein